MQELLKFKRTVKCKHCKTKMKISLLAGKYNCIKCGETSFYKDNYESRFNGASARLGFKCSSIDNIDEHKRMYGSACSNER